MKTILTAFSDSLGHLSRSALGTVVLLLGVIAVSAPVFGQNNNCRFAQHISGTGQWPFSVYCCPPVQWQLIGCGGFDDSATFKIWTALADGDYKIYTSGVGSTSFAVASETDCSIANQHVIECRHFSDLPIFLPGVIAGESFLIETATGYNGPSRLLHVDEVLCGPSHFVDDALEENDTLAQAVAMVEGIHPGLAVRSSDPDFYQVLIPAGEELRVRTSDSGPEVRVTLYDFLGQAVDSTQSGVVASYSPGSNLPRRAFIGIETPTEAGLENCSGYALHIVTHPLPQSFEVFCDPATPNSTGASTVLHVVEDRLTPHMDGLVFAYGESGPPNQFGYIIAGDQVLQLGLPMGAQPICIGGNIGRYNAGGTPLDSIGVFNAAGQWRSFSNTQSILTPQAWIWNAYAIPEQLPNGMGVLMSGHSWGFQLWHREIGGGSSTSNGVLVNW